MQHEATGLKVAMKEQWHEKVWAEENYVRLEAESNETVANLKRALELKNDEITRLSASLAKMSQPQGNHVNKKFGLSKRPAISEEHWDNAHKVARLEDEIDRLKSEKSRSSDSEKRHKEEMDKLRTELRETVAKLERQYTSFLSLKRTFNDIKEENDKLRFQLQSARVKNIPTLSTQNSNTWPKNTQPPSLVPMALRKRVSDTGPAHGLPAVRPTVKSNTFTVFGKEQARVAKGETKATVDSLPPVSHNPTGLTRPA